MLSLRKLAQSALGLVAAGLVASSLTFAQDANTAPVEIKIPRPAYVGTPKEIKGTTAKRNTGKRPAWYAPKGVTLLSTKKPVTSSDKEPIIGSLPQITDGDKEGTEGSWVELGPGLQWVQIDLGKPADIHGVVIWHHHAEARVYRDVVVQVSDDQDFISNVQTIYNNDNDNSAGLGLGKDNEFFEYYEGELIPVTKVYEGNETKPVKSVKGRYVRLYSKGNTSDDQNHYTEVEVFGIAN